MSNFNARIKLKRDTAVNWTVNNPVLLNGEIILIDTDSGELRAKVGDGTKTYTQLPFTDEILRNLITNKQNKLTGTQGQIVGFNSSGNAIAVDPPSSLPEGGSEGKLLGYGTEPEWVDNIADTCVQLDSRRAKSLHKMGITDLNNVTEAGTYVGMSYPPDYPAIANVPQALASIPFVLTVKVDEGKGPYHGSIWNQTIEQVGLPVKGMPGAPYFWRQGNGDIASSPAGWSDWEMVTASDVVTATNKTVFTSAWSSDSTYADLGFNYRASVSVSRVTGDYIPDINFSPADQYSSNLASFADTYNGGVYIYAKTKPTETVTIESAIFTRS